MLQKLKKNVFEANLSLAYHKLVIFTWGNASAIDRSKGLVIIKPSGVGYDVMTADDMVIVNMCNKVVEGKYKPSSDTATHIELYKAFPEIAGIVHTHSTYATAWAQAGRNIPSIGTTHSDYFYGDIPCTRDMTAEEIKDDYEQNTGKVIAERFETINAVYTPGVLVKNHGPFTWGKDVSDAVHNAVVLEQLAKMAYLSYNINSSVTMNNFLIDKHFYRKHGVNAYYGQNKSVNK